MKDKYKHNEDKDERVVGHAVCGTAQRWSLSWRRRGRAATVKSLAWRGDLVLRALAHHGGCRHDGYSDVLSDVMDRGWVGSFTMAGQAGRRG